MNLKCALATPRHATHSLTVLCKVLVQSALSKLRVLSARVDTLALFAPNEKFEELSVGHTPYMTVHYVVADLELSARAMEPEIRLERIKRAVVSLQCTCTLTLTFVRSQLTKRRLGSIEELFVTVGGLRGRS
jgi:hypothetical protein